MPMRVMLARGQFATGYFSKILRFTQTAFARREFRNYPRIPY